MRRKGMHKKLASILVAAAMVMTSMPTYAATPDASQEAVVVEEAAVPALEEGAGAEENTTADGNEQTTETTLQNQIDEEGSEVEISLSKDTTESITIPKEKKVTLNLNGHTLTNEAGKNTITNNGNLMITGAGTVDNVSHGKAAVINNVGATAILDGGTYTRSMEAGVDPENSGGNSFYTLLNHGTMRINDGVEVTQNGHFSSMIENGWQNGDDNKDGTPSVLTIAGGTFKGGLNTVKNDDYGELEITGGDFKNVSQAVILNWNEAEIKGGTFVSDKDVILNGYLNDTMDKGDLTITGGTFTAADGHEVIDRMGGSKRIGDIAVSGGTYNQAIPAEYCVDGYIPVENGAGNYIVEAVNVAQIGEKAYPTLQEAFAAEEAGTVTLLRDTTESSTITIKDGKQITLNLNGKTIQVPAGKPNLFDISANAGLTITDTEGGKIISKEKKLVEVNGENSSFTLEKGDLRIKKDYGVYALNGGTAVVKGGSIHSQQAPLSGNNTTGDMYFKVEGGVLTADQGAAIYMPGQVEMDISGGTLNGGLSLRMGQVNITGGTINGPTDPALIDDPKEYYAYGGNVWYGDAIYVNGGTYTSTNPEYGNSLKLNITGGTFHSTYGSAVALYVNGLTEQEMNVSITGGEFAAANDKDSVVAYNMEEYVGESYKEDYQKIKNTAEISVSEGYFNTLMDPSYIEEGKALLPNGDDNAAMYGYKVAEAAETDVKPVVGEPTVDISEEISEADREKVEEAAARIEAKELGAYANGVVSKVTEEEIDKAKADGVEAFGEAQTYVYAQTFLDIKPTAFATGEGDENAVYTLNIQPMYQLVVSTVEPDSEEEFVFAEGEKRNALKIEGTEELLENANNITLTIPLPDGFLAENSDATSLFVKHMKNDGKIYYHNAAVKVTEDGHSISFMNDKGFSTFTILAEDTVAEVNGIGYSKLSAAIEAANASEVVLLSDVTEAVETSENANATLNLNGHTITGTLINNGMLTIKGGKITDNITSNGTTYIESGEFNGTLVKGENGKFSITGGTFTDGQLKPEYIAPGHVIEGNTVRPATPSGGGGGTTTPSYTITAPAETEGGKVIASGNSANQGDTVTLTVEAKEGYELDELIVTDASGAKIELTESSDGKFTFQMPGSNVEIKATFKVEGQQKQEIVILKAQARDLADRTLNDKDTKVKFAKGKAPKTDVIYESSNDKVVAVDEEGHIHYTGLGEAVITVKAAETEEYKAAEVSVTVKVGLKQPTFTPSARDNGFTVTSSTVKGAEKFQVQYVLKGRSFKHDSAKSKTFTVDNKLRKGKVSAANKKTYRIRVRAINGDVKSKWSPVKTITTK